MKSNWDRYGFSREELALLETFDIDSDDHVTGLYIEAERRSFYDEFYTYLKENGYDPYSF